MKCCRSEKFIIFRCVGFIRLGILNKGDVNMKLFYFLGFWKCIRNVIFFFMDLLNKNVGSFLLILLFCIFLKNVNEVVVICGLVI